MQATPEWMNSLTLQKQAVLLMALRGPDGLTKMHPTKYILQYLRAEVVKAAHKGRMLEINEHVPTMMTMRDVNGPGWLDAVRQFIEHADCLHHHYFMHFMHAVQVLGFEHPDGNSRQRWFDLHLKLCDVLHMQPESREQYEKRLGDFGRAFDEIIY